MTSCSASSLPKHTHARPMLSLANSFNAQELAEWEERNARLVPEVKTAGYIAEIKSTVAVESRPGERLPPNRATSPLGDSASWMPLRRQESDGLSDQT
jgi:hypothetical protein